MQYAASATLAALQLKQQSSKTGVSNCSHHQFFPSSASTLRGSYSKSYGRCMISGLHLVSRFFLENSRIKSAHVHVDRASSHKVELGLRHFTCKFSHKMVLPTCPCAPRLRRLAQSEGRGLGIRLGTAFSL